jgi:hypothetical protein
MKGRNNAVLHEHDYTPYKKLAVWLETKEQELARPLSKEAIFALIFLCMELLKS